MRLKVAMPAWIYDLFVQVWFLYLKIRNVRQLVPAQVNGLRDRKLFMIIAETGEGKLFRCFSARSRQPVDDLLNRARGEGFPTAEWEDVPVSEVLAEESRRRLGGKKTAARGGK